jgi:hypothetical protein
MASHSPSDSPKNKKSKKDSPKDYALVDLKIYPECMYLSKSLTLKRLMGEIIDKDVVVNELLHDMLRRNLYREFDLYVSHHPGREQFLQILQQIFLFKYFLPAGLEPLTNRQTQNALGIQQVRWVFDDENLQKNNRITKPLTFHYYEELVDSPSHTVNERMMEARNFYDGVGLEDIYRALQGSVWYTYDDADYQQFVPKTTEEFMGNIFGIPESYSHLCTIACIHPSELIFGSLSSTTIGKHYIFREKRPYNAHLPSTLPNNKMNISEVHKKQLDILNIWIHDFQHQLNGVCDNDEFFETLNHEIKQLHDQQENLNPDVPVDTDYGENISDETKKRLYDPFLGRKIKVTINNLKAELLDKESELNYFLRKKPSFFHHFNDTPPVYDKSKKTRCFGGGKRRNKKRRTLKQTGGLLGHVTGFHLSDRGVRHILMGNHAVKKRYTQKLREKCKEHIMYHPKITFANENIQMAYNLFRKGLQPSADMSSIVCGNSGPLLKQSSYSPKGTQFIGEGFQSILKEFRKKIEPEGLI